MKKAAFLAAGAAAMVVAATVPALGADKIGASKGTKLTAGATPTKSGTKRKPRFVKIHTVFQTPGPAAGQPGFATKRTIVHLPKGLRFRGNRFTSCTEAILNSQGPNGCKSSSKVGTGKAQGLALGQVENLTVTAFNGPKGKTLLLYVQGGAPLAINSTIVGKLKSDKGKYGYKLDVAIPSNLQQPLQGVFATLTKFETRIGVRKGKRNYAESFACKGKKRYWGADLYFTDGTVDKTTTTSKCS